MAQIGRISWQSEQMARLIEDEEQTARVREVRDVIVNLLAWSALFGAGFWTGFWTGLALLA